MAEGGIVITLPPDLDPATLERILAAIPQGAATLAAPEAAIEADATAAAFDAALATAPSLDDAVAGALANLDAVPPGLLATLALAAGAMGAAYATERLLRGLWRPSAGERPGSFAGVLWLALRAFAGRMAGLALFVLLSLAAVRLVLPPEALPAAQAVIGAVATQRLLYLIVEALAAPGAPQRRLAGLDDRDAAGVMRILAVILCLGLALGVAFRLVDLGDPSPDTRLARVLLSLVSTIPGVIFFWLVRRPVAGLIVKAFGGPDAVAKDAVGRFAATWWHALYILMALMTALSKAAAQLDLPGFGAVARSGVMTTLVAALAPFLLAGVGLWRDERLARGTGSRGLVVGGAALARGLIVAGAASFLLSAWGLDPFAPPREGASGLATLIPSFVRALFVVIVGLALWRAIGEAMAALGERPALSTAPIDEDKTIGQGASRLQTVMPVLRGAALTAIALTTAMVALSSLGVNIAPILAGAGVLGLAIGFGSQQLVRDVISGAFYLYEDAFRVGEYIETGQGKGVVEHISIRSVRLRHPRGPVFTVPFATMGTIQNHSRDWVKVKFTFDVPQETDLEKVRKIVKKAGEALIADPDLEGRFLEPMKSQGAVAINGQAFSVGVKFVTRPGQQFLARRKAMAALQKAFKDNGIDLMTPRITLDRAAGPEDIAKAMATAAS